RGRKSICELMVISPELIELIEGNQPSSVIRHKAREQGMRTLREDGVNTVLSGESTIDEILRYT
ncbi:MAG: hypothetical protein PHQ27_03680, partial [Victivallales bacterium]|nr:hypothetical protein [Victivallales bacterium]